MDFQVDHYNLDVVDLHTYEFNYQSNDLLKQFAERPFAAKYSKGKVSFKCKSAK